MGLFNRHESDHEPEEGDLQLPTRDDFQQPLVEESRSKTAGRYGIDDAIQLMRQLPKDADERMMEVICKTLESAQIRTADVLQDADHKEQKIRRQHKGIEQEIANLQAQIDERQNQLAQLSDSLEELTRIKARFESVSGRPPASASMPTGDEESSPALDEEPLSSLSNLESESDDVVATPINAGRRGRGTPR